MTVFYDARWKDEVMDLEVETEVLKESERRLKRQLEQRTQAAGKAVEMIVEKNKELEAEMNKSYARKQAEQGEISLADWIRADYGGGGGPEPVEGQKRRERREGWILDVYGDNADQPTTLTARDAKRQAIYKSQWDAATFSHLEGLDVLADVQQREEARQAEAKRKERERLARLREKTEKGGHVYGG